MMVDRRTILIGIAATALSSSASAAERMVYDPQAFQASLDTGKPVLVHVTAAWCGECAQQKPIVARLASEPEFKDLIIVDVDFDKQKDALRQLRVTKQSTLLLFKGKTEIARLVGDTEQEAIEALMRRAL